MKRFLIIALLLAFASSAYGAGTCTVGDLTRGTLHGAGTSVIQLQVDCTADAADGSFPDTTISSVGGYLTTVYVDPGATVPTNAMDMTVEIGSTGFDILGGEGMNIETSANAIISPKNTAGDNYLAGFAGGLTVKLSGNSVNSATLTYYLIFAP